MFVSKKRYDDAVRVSENYRKMWYLEGVHCKSIELRLKQQMDYVAQLQKELENSRRFNRAPPAAEQFTSEELRTLLLLCHPDKHGGKESAQRITQKLLKMR